MATVFPPVKNPSVGDTPLLGFVCADENGIVDFSGADTLTVRFRLPDGSYVTVAGVVVQPPAGTGDGKDGRFGYYVPATVGPAPPFIAQSGMWERQGAAHWPDGRYFSTSVVRFWVDAVE